MHNLSLRLTYASLIILALGTFSSISLSAISHILLALPGIYFLYQFCGDKNNFKKLNASVWALIALIFVIGLSVVSNLDLLEHPVKTFFKTKYFIMGIFSIVSFFELFKAKGAEKKIKVLLWIFLIATTLASLSGIIGLFSGFNPIKFKAACHKQRACGLFGMYMTYGYGISMFLMLNTGLLIYRDKVSKFIQTKWVLLAWIINFLGLFLSYTRGGWIAFLLAVPFFFFKKNKKVFLSIVSVAAVVFALSFAFVPKVKNMFLNRGSSDSQRLAFYEAAYKVFTEYPIVGIGYRNFEPNSQKYKKKYNIAHQYQGGHAHSNYFEHLASTGLLGLIVFVSFILLWLREVYKRDDLIALLCFPFIINFTISGLFQYTFGDGENLFLIMGVYAISQLKSLEV